MEQTLQIGDRLLVNRLDPVIERQDVVVFGHGITWSDRELPPADGALSQFARNVGDIIGFRTEQYGIHGQTRHRDARREGQLLLRRRQSPDRWRAPDRGLHL